MPPVLLVILVVTQTRWQSSSTSTSCRLPLPDRSDSVAWWLIWCRFLLCFEDYTKESSPFLDSWSTPLTKGLPEVVFWFSGWRSGSLHLLHIAYWSGNGNYNWPLGWIKFVAGLYNRNPILDPVDREIRCCCLSALPLVYELFNASCLNRFEGAHKSDGSRNWRWRVIRDEHNAPDDDDGGDNLLLS